MSKSIDWHEGYIQCLTDIAKDLPPEFSVKDAIQTHTDEIGKILDDMYKEYQKQKK